MFLWDGCDYQGLKICIIFFFECIYLQNLYQYAFSFSNIERKFLIYTLSPRRAVPCSEELLLSDGAFGSAFAVEDNEDGIDPAVLFVRVDKSENNHDQDVESNALLMGSDHDAEAVHLYPLDLGILHIHNNA